MCILLSILSAASGINEANKEKEQKSFKKEIDSYDLEDWQKELVRKGEYQPWNFEEEGEQDEEDYYYEDN